MPINFISTVPHFLAGPAAAGARTESAFDPSTNPRAYSVQTINGPPPCPLNILEQDWDELIDRLSEELTFKTWCEAVMCGFSTTPMGQSTGWLWHDILIEKSGLADLHAADYRRLCRMLEMLWTKCPQNPRDAMDDIDANDTLLHPDQDIPFPLTTNDRNLLGSLGENNQLAKFIIRRSIDQNVDSWFAAGRSGDLVAQLIEELPLLAKLPSKYPRGEEAPQPFRPGIVNKKIDRFLLHLDEREREYKDEPWRTIITEPVIQEITEHLFTHMKDVHRRQPEATTEEMIKTWDAKAAADSISLRPRDDDCLALVFWEFSQMARYE